MEVWRLATCGDGLHRSSSDDNGNNTGFRWSCVEERDVDVGADDPGHATSSDGRWNGQVERHDRL